MTTIALSSPALAPKSPAPGFLARTWASLIALGERRAAAEMRRFAVLHLDSNPELARQLLSAANRSPA